jgi:3-oxoacyl-[acyl-carrier protein] reductase
MGRKKYSKGFKARIALDAIKGQKTIDECNCTDPTALASLKEPSQARWHGLDIVLSNIGDSQSVLDPLTDDIQWKKTWANNFESVLHTASIFLPMLIKSKGCFLFVSAITAMEAFGAPDDYSTAKTAVTVLAKYMGIKLAQEVRINVLAPGKVWFPGGSWDEKIKDNPNKVDKIIEFAVPMKRFGSPEEMADAAVFL